MSNRYRCLQLAVAGSVATWVPVAFVVDVANGNGIQGGIQRMFGSLTVWVSPSVGVSMCSCFLLLYSLMLFAVFLAVNVTVDRCHRIVHRLARYRVQPCDEV